MPGFGSLSALFRGFFIEVTMLTYLFDGLVSYLLPFHRSTHRLLNSGTL